MKLRNLGNNWAPNKPDHASMVREASLNLSRTVYLFILYMTLPFIYLFYTWHCPLVIYFIHDTALYLFILYMTLPFICLFYTWHCPLIVYLIHDTALYLFIFYMTLPFICLFYTWVHWLTFICIFYTWVHWLTFICIFYWLTDPYLLFLFLGELRKSMMIGNVFFFLHILVWLSHYAKRSLMVWVAVIPKEGRVRPSFGITPTF